MGSGSTAYRAALGEAMAIEAHEKAMIPITLARGEMELELQKQLFEQKYEQSEKLGTLPSQLEIAESARRQPVFMSTTAPPPVPKNLVKVALVILALVFLFKRK